MGQTTQHTAFFLYRRMYVPLVVVVVVVVVVSLTTCNGTYGTEMPNESEESWTCEGGRG